MRWQHDFLWSLLKVAMITIINMTSDTQSFFSVQPKQERSKHAQSKIQASAQMWQAVLLLASLWSHTADSLSPRLRTDCPLWFGLSMLPWYMLGLCGGDPYTPPTTSWKDQPVEHESCPTAGSLQDEEGLPSHLPLHWPALQPGRRQWGWPWKKPWIYFISCSQITFHGYPTGDKAVPLCGSPFWLCWYKILLKTMGKL